MAITETLDFRGGYFVDTPSSLMSASDFLIAQDAYWRNGLIKRKGIAKYSSTAFTGTLRGGFETQQGSTWFQLVAVDNGATVSFYYATTASYTKITGQDFTTGYNVEFDVLNNHVIAVNNKDKPMLLDYTTSWTIKTVESNDVRTLGLADWWAGQYTATSGAYTDDTTDAQSDATADFAFCTTVNNDGFWVASDFTFNKIAISGAQQTATTTAAYEYWNGSAWATCSMVTSPTWTATAGLRTIEFDYPSAWVTCSSTVGGASSNISGRYTFRCRFTTAPAAAKSAQKLALSHTQYLTQVLGGDTPKWVRAHASRIWLGSGNSNNVYYSVANVVTGWKLQYAEYFLEGGSTIEGLESWKDRLIVGKANAIHEYTGNTFETFVKRKVADHGVASGRAMKSVGDYLVRPWNDGIWAWDGTADRELSKHIKTDLSSWTLTDACAVFYYGEYWCCFPTNSKLILFDPDTMRTDPVGDQRVSFFKFTNHKVNQFIYDQAQGTLYGITNATAPYVAKLDSGTKDFTTASTTITWAVKPRFNPFTEELLNKYFVRGAVKLFEPSVTSSYTCQILSDDGDKSATFTITPSVGTGFYRETFSIPYTLDGKNLTVYLTHSAKTNAGLAAFAIDARARGL